MSKQEVASIDTPLYRDRAAANLWRHFAQMDTESSKDLRIFVGGEGSYLIDSEGRRFLDGLSNLFCVNIGYSYGEELGQAALEQYSHLGYHSNWGSTHLRAVELADRLADLAPNDLNHVFFTPSGGESIEAAWKIARQYYDLRGERRWKAISRSMAYHGTTLGALSLNGITEFRTPFEPLVPGGITVSNARRIDRPEGETEEQFTAFLLDELERRIIFEGPETVAMLVQEPVQNHGGMLVPPVGYAAGVRELADRYGILLVADETITAFGRVGAWFGSERYESNPDIITTAKGLSSAHAVIGAVITNERVFEPFARAGRSLTHGNTFGGHPVMAAVALKNLEILERLDLNAHVLQREDELGSVLQQLSQFDVVLDVRGTGYFWAIELVSRRPDGTFLTDVEKEFLYGTDALATWLEDEGVMLRISADGGDPIINIAPPLVAETAEFELLYHALNSALERVSERYSELK